MHALHASGRSLRQIAASLTEAGHRAPLGVAQTMCSLTPIFILPFMAIVHGERLTGRAIIGAAIAVAGTGLLLFVCGETG